MRYIVEATGERGEIRMINHVVVSHTFHKGALVPTPLGQSVETRGDGIFLQATWVKNGKAVAGPIYYLDGENPGYRRTDITYFPNGLLQCITARDTEFRLDADRYQELVGMRIKCRR